MMHPIDLEKTPKYTTIPITQILHVASLLPPHAHAILSALNAAIRYSKLYWLKDKIRLGSRVSSSGLLAGEAGALSS